MVDISLSDLTPEETYQVQKLIAAIRDGESYLIVAGGDDGFMRLRRNDFDVQFDQGFSIALDDLKRRWAVEGDADDWLDGITGGGSDAQ